MKKMVCELEVCDFTSKDGFKGKSLILTTPNGTRAKIGSFKLNSKLVYKLVCEVEGKENK